MNKDFPASDRGTPGATGSFSAASALLTVAEVARAMRVSNMTVYRLIKAGDLAAVRVGHSYRIRETDVERYLRERSVFQGGG
jgi:excisionase family DNA binding protein